MVFLLFNLFYTLSTRKSFEWGLFYLRSIYMVVNAFVGSLLGLGLNKITEQFDKSVNSTAYEM